MRAAIVTRVYASLESMLDPSQLVPERMRPLRRTEYERLVEAGCFEDERVELLCGVLVEMSPQGGRHSRVVAQLHRYFVRGLPDDFQVRGHSPFAAGDYSEPEPDVEIVPVSRSNKHPRRAYLLIEVADSSLRKDRHIKTKIYAAARVPEYWIVDLAGRAVEVYTEPKRGAYTKVVRVRRGTLRPVALPITIAVADVF